MRPSKRLNDRKTKKGRLLVRKMRCEAQKAENIFSDF